MTKKRARKVAIIICIVLIVLVIILPSAIAFCIYQTAFGVRYQTPDRMLRDIGEFDGLKREKYSFASNKGQILTGYKYCKDGEGSAKGVVILVHGFGVGGHSAYMPIADYLTSNGYIVFSSDATANDESEGNAVGGLPQGVIDLDYALRFVKGSEDFAGLPIMLFGHSWGAYSSGAVLNIHKDIKAVVMGAGFNKSIEMLDAVGSRYAGPAAKLALPFCQLLEKIKFGDYASMSSMGGFDGSSAGVMIIHSSDDNLVPFDRQYAVFNERYRNDPRFAFVRFDGKGHSGLFGSGESNSQRDTLESGLRDYTASGRTKAISTLTEKYRNRHNGTDKLYEVDAGLMDKIIAFYDSWA